MSVKEYNYVVDSIEDMSETSPAELRIFRNPPSDCNPDVGDKEIDNAIVSHCMCSYEQIKDYDFRAAGR